MKKLLFIIFLIPGLASAQERFVITGKVGYKNAAIAILTYQADGKARTDTARITDGAFTFTGTVTKTVWGNIDVRYYAAANFKNITDKNHFYLENKSIAINSAGYVKDARITGTPLNDKLMELKDHLAVQKPSGAPATSEVYAQYAMKNTDSPVGLYALHNAIYYNVDENYIQGILEKFNPELRASATAKGIQAAVDIIKNTRPGKPAPLFTQNNEKGNPVSLASFKGKYVLVDFWASWCQPCRVENPNLVSVHYQFKDKSFTILGVSLDHDRNSWLKAIKDDQLQWAQVSDLKYFDNEVAKQYGIRAVPTNFLVGPDGTILAKNLFGDQLRAKLKELLTPVR